MASDRTSRLLLAATIIQKEAAPLLKAAAMLQDEIVNELLRRALAGKAATSQPESEEGADAQEQSEQH